MAVLCDGSPQTSTMATARCSSCSSLVAFRGRKAICPQCSNTVLIPGSGAVLDHGESADPEVGPPMPTLVAEYNKGRSQTLYGGSVGMGPIAKVVIFGTLAVVLVAALLGAVWWFLSLPRNLAAPVAAPAAPAPVVAPTPAPPPPPRRPATQVAPVQDAPAPPPPIPAWTVLRPQAPSRDLKPAVSEARITDSIKRGVEFLLSQMDGPYLSAKTLENVSPDQQGGLNALVVYSLLAAGRELQDPRLDPRAPGMRAMLDRVKTSSLDGDRAVYSRSLRLQCLAFANRPEDRATLEADTRWLLRAHIEGAFGYQDAKPGQTKDTLQWDTSNSQYGLLGIWAASMAGIDTPATFWTMVEQHWLATQDIRTGGWGYPRAESTIRGSMTAAGVNALLVAGDQLTGDRGPRGRDAAPTRAAIQRGLEQLAIPANLFEFQRQHFGYIAYSIERVGLASGFKYFGNVDWFRAIADVILREQRADGSWDRVDPGPTDTAFCVLFLVRGRPPVMMAKLKYDGPWQRYPRDLANLALYASQKTERQMNWQVSDLTRPWQDWMDAPVLMLSGNAAIPLTDDQVNNLRQYLRHGGVLFTHADTGAQAFTDFVRDLAPRLVDGAELAPLPPDHPIYTLVLRPNPTPPLMGVSNGNRVVLVHSPTDLSIRWLRRVAPTSQQNMETGLNIFVHSAGKTFSRARVETPILPTAVDPPSGMINLARIKFTGNWDPEPAAWARLAQAFELATRIRVAVTPATAIELPPPLNTPIATMTILDAVGMTDAEVAALRQWVGDGGVLLIDPVGGNTPAQQGVADVVGRLLPPSAPAGTVLAAPNPLLTGTPFGAYGLDVSKVSVTDYTLAIRGGRVPPPRVHALGRGMILVAELDMTTALLESNVWGIAGYTPAWSRGFVQNLLLSIGAGAIGPGAQAPGTDGGSGGAGVP